MIGSTLDPLPWWPAQIALAHRAIDRSCAHDRSHRVVELVDLQLLTGQPREVLIRAGLGEPTLEGMPGPGWHRWHPPPRLGQIR